ncbi:MAG: CsgG/HfaB family protein [Alphaproteobacteria bacterium]|nr:CsgG/HfaB family protein [Alphaproteobacteria bacterium]
MTLVSSAHMTTKAVLSACMCLLLAGCGDMSSAQKFFDDSPLASEAEVTDTTPAGRRLNALPAPTEKIAVAVYDFQDQTGQFKYNGKFTDYSSAVTKGGDAILTKALLDAGNSQWFMVAERGNIQQLLQERQIIKMMRGEYGDPNNQMPALPPLVYAGMMISGGIVSYDSNIITGGAGAIYLGIGASSKYHQDIVTIYLRATSIKTGEVLLSVTSSKTIYSTELDSNVLKYITFDRLLQAEVGFTVNEPTQLGVRQAIESGVYSLIMEGALRNLWSFNDPASGQKAIEDYLARRDGPPKAGTAAVPAAEQPAPVEPAVERIVQPAPVVQEPEPQPEPVAQPEPQADPNAPVYKPVDYLFNYSP